MKKRILSLLIALLMIVSLIAPTSVQAATIKLNKSKVTLYEGKTYQLKLKGTDDSITWKSSNEYVATVDKKGKVTAVDAGYSYITATCGSKEYTCRVTVKFDNKAAAKNVSFERYNIDNGIVTVVTNNNDTHVSIADTIYFYSGNDIINSEKKTINFIAPNSSFAYIFNKTSGEYSDYKNTVKVSKLGLKDMRQHVKVVEEKTDNKIDLRISNYNELNIITNIAILYYKEDKVVGFDNNTSFITTTNSTTLVNFFMPAGEDDSNKVIPYSYKMYIQAYSNR